MQFTTILLALASSQAVFGAPTLPTEAAPPAVNQTMLDDYLLKPNVTAPGLNGTVGVKGFGPDQAQALGAISRKPAFFTEL